MDKTSPSFASVQPLHSLIALRNQPLREAHDTSLLARLLIVGIAALSSHGCQQDTPLDENACRCALDGLVGWPFTIDTCIEGPHHACTLMLCMDES